MQCRQVSKTRLQPVSTSTWMRVCMNQLSKTTSKQQVQTTNSSSSDQATTKMQQHLIHNEAVVINKTVKCNREETREIQEFSKQPDQQQND